MMPARPRLPRLAFAMLMAAGLSTSAFAQAPPPAPAPVMTGELMQRLITRTLASTLDSAIPQYLSGLFGFNSGRTDLPAKQITLRPGDRTVGFVVPLSAGVTDVVILVLRGDLVSAYRSDRAGALRDAAVLDRRQIAATVRRIALAEAAASFETEMSELAIQASRLPATVPGNNQP